MKQSEFEINENSEERFYRGWLNRSFRVYSYFQEGLNHVGQFKTIAYFLIGIGLVFKVPQDQYMTLAWIGLASCPPILLFGYIMKVRGNRSMEYFNIRDLSPYAKYGMEMQREQMVDQKEIIKLLKEIKEKLNN